MGPGETLAMLGLCAFGIALIVMIFASYGRRLKFKERKLEIEAGHAAGDRTAGSNELIARLEKRVRVLERLATERGPDVAAQIEALREDRALADHSTGVNAK